MTLFLIWLLTEFDVTEYRFPCGFSNGCSMPTGDAYSSGHLVPSLLGLAYVLLVKTNPFPEFVVIVLDYALRTALGTFSMFLITILLFQFKYSYCITVS